MFKSLNIILFIDVFFFIALFITFFSIEKRIHCNMRIFFPFLVGRMGEREKLFVTALSNRIISLQL